MNQYLVTKNIKNLVKLCPLEKLQVYGEDITLVIKSHFILDILLFVKYHIPYQFDILTCISSTDYPTKKYRFEIIYELLSIKYNTRLKIKVLLHELMTIDSCDQLFLSAGWYECEIWDMFGVFFKNHSHLKRILTDYGFEGYPLRKDFPLSGFIEMKYNETQKRVVSEALEFGQEYRTFLFLSPWEQKVL